MVSEWKGGVTFQGKPLTVIGTELKVGDSAPDFKVLSSDLNEVTLKRVCSRGGATSGLR